MREQASAATDDRIQAEFGPLMRRIARRYFAPVRLSEQDTQALADLHQRGFVVHVMRSSAWVNYLYLSWTLLFRGLPPIRAVVNLRRFFTKPWRKTAQRGKFEVRFTYARRHSGSGLVFLRDSAFFTLRGKIHVKDPFPALISFARKADRPVFLVPELFVLEKAGARLRANVVDYVFGSPEAPGFLHTLVAFFRNYRRSQFRVGDPIDLTKFVQDQPGESDLVLARKVRSALSQHLARETRAVYGPAFKHTDRLIEETLRDPVLTHALGEVAQKSGRRFPGLLDEAKNHLNEIAARQSPTAIGLMAPILSAVFNRIYDGIEVDEASLSRAMKAGTRAPLILCASHKSHVDYLVLAYVLWMRGYGVPRVAAGSNLSFFPLGNLFRRGGAFFLRRSFKEDRVYAATFRAYVKKLIQDGIPQEFFPEGGRSRTGKLLMPKLGMFTWQVDALLEGAADDLMYLPVSIDYEKIVESASYSRELLGGEKQTESLRGLLKTPKVLARHYGRIHVVFDEPVSLAELMRQRGLEPLKPPDDRQRRALVRALGYRTMYGISRAATITPSALIAAALLGDRGEAVSGRSFVDRILFLRRVAQEEGIRLSKSLQGAPADPTVLGPIHDAVMAFEQDGLVRLQERNGQTELLAVGAHRGELSFYKNTLINMVVGRALVASALLAEGISAPHAKAKDNALFLSRLFKLEFTYPINTPFEIIFDRAVEKLMRDGLLLRKGELLEVAPEAFSKPTLQFLADMVHNFLESYLITVSATELLASGPMEKKTWVKHALARGQAGLVSGTITAPESLSQPTIENALSYLLEQNFLVEDKKKLSLSRGFSDPEARAKVGADIRRFLMTRSPGP